MLLTRRKSNFQNKHYFPVYTVNEMNVDDVGGYTLYLQK
jgi:hypothetical protein